MVEFRLKQYRDDVLFLSRKFTTDSDLCVVIIDGGIIINKTEPLYAVRCVYVSWNHSLHWLLSMKF